MGIHSRDYIQESSGSSGFGGGGTSVVTRLIIATVVVFVLQFLTLHDPSDASLRRQVETLRQFDEYDEYSNEQLTAALRPVRTSFVEDWFELRPRETVFGGQIWRLVTCAFCHDRGSVWHILFNMLFLWWFGRTLEAMYGSREFLLFYLGAAVTASVCFLLLAFFFQRMNPMIGASGAVMGVLMLYAMHYPRQRIYIWGIIPVEIRWLVAFYVVVDLHPILLELGGARVGDGVAHSAHLGGLLFGFLYRKFDWRLEHGLGWFRRPRLDRLFGSRRKIKLHRPPAPAENLDTQVDAILAKISTEGEASLTDREREILRTASERYKKRSTT